MSGKYFLFLGFILLAACPARAESVAEEKIQEGVQLRDQGKFAEAEAYFLRAIEKEPTLGVYHFELASVYAAQQGLWRQYPDHPRAKRLLAQSEDQLLQAITLDPTFLPAHYNLGIIQKNRGLYEEARASFKKVIELNPRSIWAWMQIGEIYETQGFFEDAEDAYRKAKELDYFNPEIDRALRSLKERAGEQKTQVPSRSRWETMALPGGGIRAPFYRSRTEPGAGLDASNRSVSPVAALPYVASMLYQQFMNFRAERKVESGS
ncbi:MAG: tetratricopeptide repeat protein [Candidatus Omnitrophota bacterium]